MLSQVDSQAMTEPARTVKFRLYTGREGSSLYVRVRVFNTKGDMLAKLHAESHGLIRLPRTTRGVMAATPSWVRTEKRIRWSPLMGTMNLCQQHLDIETV